MSLAREIARAHNGDLTLDPAIPEQTGFTLTYTNSMTNHDIYASQRHFSGTSPSVSYFQRCQDFLMPQPKSDRLHLYLSHNLRLSFHCKGDRLHRYLSHNLRLSFHCKGFWINVLYPANRFSDRGEGRWDTLSVNLVSTGRSHCQHMKCLYINVGVNFEQGLFLPNIKHLLPQLPTNAIVAKRNGVARYLLAAMLAACLSD